ncbi:hypothetical protein CAPTEDRAFT_228964 [Capitella teleta]|uniref:DUF1330 domain-containing protein n=1 Tax=Capitella teleta TaxID=283909 RepID=R7TZM7_CAPTE|nr:hypothetical protein CAPTEDRAFT_228964 [Capitella teleta]|eukprot:ELT99092.1 hypothetical protein CAPTEDRAFT_228964 [Capitella teleta]
MADSKGGAMLLIRYGVNRKQACKNSLSKWRSVHHVYEGCVSGVSSEVEQQEGHWPRAKGVALLSFESMKDAQMWKDCIPEIKQQDWMDGPDMVLVPMRELPPPGKRYVQILELEFSQENYQRYMSEYVPATKDILHKSGASESVVASSAPVNLKGAWNPQSLIINFWSNEEEFHKAYTSEEYKPLKEMRQELALTTSCSFHLEDLFRSKGAC